MEKEKLPKQHKSFYVIAESVSERLKMYYNTYKQAMPLYPLLQASLFHNPCGSYMGLAKELERRKWLLLFVVPSGRLYAMPYSIRNKAMYGELLTQITEFDEYTQRNKKAARKVK